MVILQKLDRLIASEIISLTFVITASLSSIMMMAKIPRYVGTLFSAPDVGAAFLMLLLYIFPSIIKFTVPISLLLASALVTIRMAADRELEAWMASGVSVLRLAFMPTVLGILVMLISLFSALIFEPYSNRQFDKFILLQSRSAVEAFLKDTIREKSFIYDAIPTSDQVKLSLYMQTVSSDRTEFTNVFLALKPSSEKYFATVVSNSGSLKKTMNEGFPDYIYSLYKGTAYSGKASENNLPYFVSENPNSFILTKKDLTDDELLSYPTPSDWTVTLFSEMNISLINTFKSKIKVDSSQDEKDTQLYPKAYLEMLKKEQEKNSEWRSDTKIIEKLIFIFKQISVPISTIFLPIIGVCLGIQDPRRKQLGVYLGVGLVIFALYASISMIQQLALNFVVSPFAMLLATPITLILIITLLLRWRLRHPPSTGFIAFVRDDLLKIKIFSKKG
jgi:lipopolysaccharide export LptBFGC system permease protein LptF